MRQICDYCLSVTPVATLLDRQVPEGALDRRIIGAALVCLARFGLAKTTLDDVARHAGCGRATVYRVFPGGKEALVRAVARDEVARVTAAVVARFEEAATLEDLLAGGLAEAARQVMSHPALAFLLAHEPEAVAPWLAFRQGDQLLRHAADVATPHLARFLAPPDARRAAEWAARVLVAFCLCPAPGVDLADDSSARSFVATFLLPGLAPTDRGSS
jgi:AcrR family transcriptional regulator